MQLEARGLVLLGLIGFGLLIFFSSRTGDAGPDPAKTAVAPAARVVAPAFERTDRLAGPAAPGPSAPSSSRALASRGREGGPMDPAKPPGGRGSIVESLLAELRALSTETDFHARAWAAMERPCEELRDEERADVLESELTALEAAYRGSTEVDLVRGACLVVMARVSPDEWFEERVQEAPGGSSEIERAYWVACAERRVAAPGMRLALTDFPSWTKLRTYPIVLERVAGAAETVAARSRLDAALPVEIFDDGARALPRVREECFTREVIVLTVFGPGARDDSDAQAQLFAWLEPKGMEDAVLTPPALFALALAARDEQEIARRLLAIARLAGIRDQLKILERLVYQGGRADLVMGPLRDLLHAAPDDAIGELNRVLATQFIDELLQSPDPQVREAAFALTVDEFLDRNNTPLYRHFLLTSLATAGGEAFVDAVTLVIETEEDPELIGYLSANFRDIGAHDPELALRLFSLLLDREGLQPPEKKVVLRRLSTLEDAGAVDLLWSIASSDPDEGIRAYARELAEAED